MKKTASVLIFLLMTFLPAWSEETGGASSAAAATGAASGSAAGEGAAATSKAANAVSASTVMDVSLPKDAKTEWTVGFSTFEVEGLSGENTYLAFSLPLLLKNELGALSTHRLSDEEKGLAAAAIITREVATAETVTTLIMKERDALAFKDAVATKSDPAMRAEIEKRLAAAAVRRTYLASLDPAKVEVAAEKPVAYKQGAEEGKLLDVPRVPRDVYCGQQGIDLLVGGSLQEVQGYLLLDIWAYDATLGRTVFSSRNAAQREELYAFISSLGKELAAVILGRQWSLVSFAPIPAESALYVDGGLAASGASSTLYLAPGVHTVRITAPGYRDVERTVTLAEGEETRIADALEKNAPGVIELSSDPEGAAVYLGSVWMGTTPLSLDAPAVQSRGELKLDGFYNQPFTLDAVSPPMVATSLTEDTGPRDARQKKARDEFYSSLVLFAVSVPLPLFSYALALDYSVEWLECANAGLSDEAATAKSTTYVFLGTYYAGIAVTVALFSWMVSRIITYVNAANETGGLKGGS